MQVDTDRNRVLFRKLAALLGRAPSHPHPDTVHQFRTMSRRIESALAVLCPEPSDTERKLLRSLKRLRRRAGRVRDLDVQIAALRKLKIGREAERRARLMNFLSEARADREDELVRWLSEKRRNRIRRRLSRLAAALDRAANHAAISASGAPAGRPSRPDSDNDVLCPGAEATIGSLDPAREALRRFASQSRKVGSLTPENLHAFRTMCKKTRYVAEMGAGETAQTIAESLRRAQVAIGDWHDWEALRLSAEDMFGHSVDSAVIMALRNVTQAKFEAARQVATEVRKELLAQYRAQNKAERESRRPSRVAQSQRKPVRRRGPASVPKSFHATTGVA